MEDTIKSVLNQNYPNLEYIVIDGGSTDNSLEIIEKYKDQIAYFESEPDNGQYYGIQRGFEKSTGDIMAWINSDDMYLNYSFLAVAQIFNKYPDVEWLMGMAKEYAEDGFLASRITLPWCRWSKHRYYIYDFQFIQQESTFWKRSLWEKAGETLDLEYKQAGDMELWARFFRYAKLHTTTIALSGFRHRTSNQRSKDFRDEYLSESLSIIEREKSMLSPGKRMLYGTLRYARFIFSPWFYYDIPLAKIPYEKMMNFPKVIHYDMEKQDYTLKDKMIKHPPFMVGKKQITKKVLKNER